MPIEVSQIEKQLSKKYREDARRMGLFVSAVASKSVELATSNPQALQPFAGSASVLITQWANLAIDIAKTPWKFVLNRDPFKDLRAETREFAKEWNLDQAFVRAMG